MEYVHFDLRKYHLLDCNRACICLGKFVKSSECEEDCRCCALSIVALVVDLAGARPQLWTEKRRPS